MTTEPSTAVSLDAVALLVVHGIGSQKRGETLNGLIGGMGRAYGDPLNVRRVAEDHAILEGIGRPIHVFEVFWADLLQGEAVKGTFDFDRVFETVWFPLLNSRSGRLSTKICPRWRVLRWTLILAPLSPILWLGFLGTRLLATLPTALQRERQRSTAARSHPVSAGGFWERARERRKDPGRTILDDVMDQVAADVLNYVYAVAKAFPVSNERNGQLARNVDEIHARFSRTAERATAQGCREIQIVAHSLGTVVAFVAMCPEAHATGSTIGTARISHFYTIGSPLEKIRFFWTRLLERSANGPAIALAGNLLAVDDHHEGGSTMKWDNFFSRADLVSGRLKEFPGWPAPVNHPARGLGGLLRSHVAYNRNAVFLNLLAAGLTGAPPDLRLSFSRRVGFGLMSTLENLILPATFVALAAVGLVFTGVVGWGMGWIVAWLVSQPLEWLDLGGWAERVRISFVALFLFVMTVVAVFVGLKRAKDLHARYWT